MLNGEIYNFRTLRDELRSEGHELRSREIQRSSRISPKASGR